MVTVGFMTCSMPVINIMDERLLPLVEMIHRYGKGYEQEGYIIG